MDLHAVYLQGEAAYFAGLPRKAEPLLLTAAEAGHLDAATRLGRLYDAAGRTEEAIRWYRSAADRGDTGAMINLAVDIEDDDREAALAWIRRAVALGAGRTARYDLGIFCEEDGLLDEAEDCYRRAADVDYPAARNRLACLLMETGRLEEAEAWFRRALDERDESCDVPDDDDYDAGTGLMYNLATLLEETARPREALSFYRQAARRGDTEAAREAARIKRAHPGSQP
ncbi:tetratricopeptide repeat protein [Actinomadura sp. DC4]|uniref:tetratricopeptide repeat protein n=1 Tax=Actinomadura sp. DC4 TaxID=3055069 RepID=UPI0025B0DE3F|nr:tetratricopeptide repeat protein [Actinomadura sp. DC4]MDN3357708.1 tetratricopeptide repeat protein [Actinomadura sp. DC4]